MKKAELKKAFQEVNSKAFLDDLNDTTLTELQELCAKYGDGHRWCCYETCLTEIIKAGDTKAISKAFAIYSKHYVIKGRNDAMTELAIKTNNFEI